MINPKHVKFGRKVERLTLFHEMMCGVKHQAAHYYMLLRGIVNHSYSKSQLDSDWNKSQLDSDWNKSQMDNRLSDTNCYEVLEKYDKVENEEIGTKSTT